MTLAQTLAVAIFLGTFVAISWGKVHRFIPAIAGAGLILVVLFGIVLKDVEAIRDILNLELILDGRFWLPGDERLQSRGINWQTILFIAGMMVMVEGLAGAGFFR